jgi:hypothetical protein
MMLVPAGMSADVYRKLSALLRGTGRRTLLQGDLDGILKKLADGINGGVVSSRMEADLLRCCGSPVEYSPSHQQQQCFTCAPLQRTALPAPALHRCIRPYF